MFLLSAISCLIFLQSKSGKRQTLCQNPVGERGTLAVSKREA